MSKFPTTHWSLLAGATLHGDADASAALGQFYSRYHEAVGSAVISRGINPEDARDITQSFFVQLMEQGALRRAQREKGRFRSYLYGALKHFMADQFDHAHAAKRGGGAVIVPLDEATAGEAAGCDTEAFDRAWALAILQRALAAVEAERHPALFAVVRKFLPGSTQVPSGSAAAAGAGMSETALRTEVSRVRQRLRALIRHEVSRTVSAPHEIDEEMAYLFAVLARE